MNEEEMKHALITMRAYDIELESKLDEIETLLGSPHAASFSAEILDAMLDDVLRYTGRRKDMRKFAMSQIKSVVGDWLMESLIKRQLTKEL